MKLATKLIILMTLILVLALGSFSLLSSSQMRKTLTEQLEKRLTDTAFFISENNDVRNALASDDPALKKGIQALAEHIRIKAGFDYIVVFNMDGIRLTHPNAENIGQHFRGGDEKRVLETGESYVSEAIGTLGNSKRAFYPVFKDGKQVGAVAVGATLIQINQGLSDKLRRFVPLVVMSMIIGVAGAAALAVNIKQDIFGLEPDEIALLLKEKEAILDHVKEGIITLDNKGDLIQYNQEASRILKLAGIEPKDIISELPQDVDSDLSVQSYDNELSIGKGSILYKISPLRDGKDRILGHVINFRDTTEVREMAEELTGIKKMAWSLRAQNHEFQNKLHTIGGLIQLGETDEAIKFIQAAARNNSDLNNFITNKIKNMNIAALILSKYYKAEESRVILDLDSESSLGETTPGIRSDEIGTIIGNLIENALDAVSTDGTGKISVFIKEDKDKIVMKVSNNGPHIPDEIKDKIFNPNFSTKPGQRGVGLNLVENIVRRNNGKIELIQDDDVVFLITLPVEGEKTV